MAVYGALSSAAGSIMGVRWRVDAGLLAIVLITIALRRPFYTITAGWAAAFAGAFKFTEWYPERNAPRP